MQTKDATRSQAIDDALSPLKALPKPHAAVEAARLYSKDNLLQLRDSGLRRELCIELCAYFQNTTVPGGVKTVWESFR